VVATKLQGVTSKMTHTFVITSVTLFFIVLGFKHKRGWMPQCLNHLYGWAVIIIL
jgi:hypothetical protein